MALVAVSWGCLGLSFAADHLYARVLASVSTIILTLSTCTEVARGAIVTAGVFGFVLTMLHGMTAFFFATNFKDCEENIDDFLKHVDDDTRYAELEETLCDDIHQTVVFSIIAALFWTPLGVMILRIPEAGDYQGGETVTTFPTPETELA